MSTQDTTLPPLDSTIAGALFDLMGWLTSHETRWVFWSRDHAGAAVEALEQWVKAKGFSIADADVTGWRAAIAAQAPQPSPLIAVGEDGEGQENHCPECGAEPGQMCSDEEGTEHGRKVHAVRQAQQAQGVPADHLPAKEHIRELAQEAADQVMEQAQVFASAWALVGGRFDNGNAMEDAEEAKSELRTLVRSLADLAAETVRPAAAPQAEPQTPEPAQPKLWRDGGTKALDPEKIQLCRVGVHSADALAMGQPCDCPAGTCRMWNGGFRPAAQAPAVEAEPPPEREPLSDEQIHNPYHLSGGAAKIWMNGFRSAERAHGIGTKGGE